MNDKKAKKVTIADLARMIKEDVVDRMATKEDLKGLETRMKTGFEGVDKRIDDFAETKATKIAHKELEVRVSFVEKKLEIKK
ncbi:hypothetical protein A3D42_00805 [Candidatus Nomurabacteria bacterium RIFCSPHIGHO2_02_FULL_41_18]|uniref:Uncharacterized protein n=1 Tax=Candidatus Nomurabacteria bacterium RIFCSPHIGHO2_02_FULL_41_18 TaxID=1801754 RepID=A0A1F6W5T3_9BACT|nr:MAG: hypothetical protein A2737_00995 [Candidatus Nomurabacteria bacterium RIFCSPHIGHO2_01_FULL_41_71]OGI77045.1 MAG: hypothetical protein A3D42_00805 [Candidatus Nomurabacteria bacterium RIFCSPHIGHO2_02_FULL_41_18]OGI90151.1 MAG: hypothetical protein A3B01_02520 [Candidatus Nomurabacteria bacterium RIFCSPLOWO2_01_FULL_41_52b]OGJ00517.1 MAG: hypothetical protein A3I90_00265 [Candidatus Nomurabacteria bacterium RIFCSPLOWO2_02_FULL_41_9]